MNRIPPRQIRRDAAALRERPTRQDDHSNEIMAAALCTEARIREDIEGLRDELRAGLPRFRSVTEHHPAGRYVCRQAERSDDLILWTDGAGLWCVRLGLTERNYAAEDPVGQTYGPIPEWP